MRKRYTARFTLLAKKAIASLTALSFCIAAVASQNAYAACSHTWYLYEEGCYSAQKCSICGTLYNGTEVWEHRFGSATCTSPAVCSKCGATGGSALGHSPRYTSSGCVWSQYCSTCNVILSSGVSHSYGDYSAWEYHSATQHSRYQTCSSCGNVSTQTESHSATDAYTDLGAAEHQHDSVCSTCTTNGATTILSTANEAHNFVYGAWTQADTAQHYRVVTCANCDHSHNEYADHADNGGDNYCDDCSWLMHWAETIYTQPVAAAIMDGETAVFSVVAGGGSGTASISYQWHIASDSSLGDAAPISGATGTTYTMQGSKTDDGKYIYVTVFNGVHTTTSDAVELTVYHTPEIYSHPTDAVVKEGEGISLQVTCYEGHGTAAPSYQWYAASDSSLSDAAPVTGASGATYAFTGTRDVNDRYFYCVISNGSYTVQTSAAHVTVYWAPDIDVQPVTQQIHENNVGQFDVAASGGNGTQEITYQWYMASDVSLSDAAPISGAAAASYTHTASFADDGKYFYCAISNGIYTVQSAAVQLITEYPIVFKNHDNTTIATGYYAIGATITAPTEFDAPQSTDPLIREYVFSGWDPAFNSVCDGRATYRATFNFQYIEYTVTFKDHDGTVISSLSYYYNDEIAVPPDPTRAADQIAAYQFAGWDKTVSPNCVGDAVYTATYESTYREYTVSFLDHDGTELTSAVYHWGDSVVAPADPTRESSNTTVYTFDGWDGEVVACAGDATYTATYQESVRLYTVRFVDHDSSVISERTDYQYEDAVVPPSDPARAEDHIGTYSFSGWSPAVVPVAGDAVYTAQYETTYKEYTVVFQDHDGTELSTAVYHWGASITTPDDPTRDDYIFMGWGSEFTGECNGSVVYTAEYAEAYIVTFLGHDGSLISSTPYYYGATVNVPTAPARGYDGTYTYTFSGWSPAVSPTCEGDATYTAVYTAVPVNVVTPGSDSGSSSPDEDSTGISFPDVPSDAWYADAIIDAVEKGLMVGMPDGSFAPLADSTRAQAVTTIYRMDGAPAATYLGAYSDVAADAWFTDAVEWGDIKDIVYGYGDGTFGPHDAITREQLVTLLWRYAQYRGYDVSLGGDSGILAYSDAHKISSWAYAAMEWACDTGLIQGTSTDILDPKGYATRAQLAVILMRFSENIVRN